MVEERCLYKLIDDRRANGVDEMDRELQKEDNEQERRHSSLALGLQEQTIWLRRQVWCGNKVDTEIIQP